MNRNHVAALAVAAGMLAATQARTQERYAVDGDRVAVYNLAGQVRVEPGSGSAVTVFVTRAGQDARELAVRQSSGAEGFRNLAVVYPGDRVVYGEGRWSNTNLAVRPDGTFGGNMNLRMLSGGGREVRISGSGSGTRAWADLRVQVPAGRTVAIHQAAGSVEVSNVNGDLRVRGHAASIRSAGTRGTLDLDTGSGSVDVRDAQGNVRIDTGSGRVSASNVTGERLEVDTGSGAVDGVGVRVGRLHVDVGSGAVRLNDVDARDVDIDTGSGSVNLRMRGDAETLRIDTGSGGVVLAIPARFGAQAEIDTGSGRIHVLVPAEVTRSSRTHFTGRFGDGRGRMVIDTGSGGVEIVQS